jgi:hypothetical protein
MEIDLDTEIIRHPDGSLEVPLLPARGAEDDPDVDPAAVSGGTITMRPGEGGYDDALAAWDLQQNPDRPPAVSTASGREQARAVVHAASTTPGDDISPALDVVDDPEQAAEALRHVLVGGNPAAADFAEEVADAHGGEPLPPHEVTKTIGNVLSELED